MAFAGGHSAAFCRCSHKVYVRITDKTDTKKKKKTSSSKVLTLPEHLFLWVVMPILSGLLVVALIASDAHLRPWHEIPVGAAMPYYLKTLLKATPKWVPKIR